MISKPVVLGVVAAACVAAAAGGAFVAVRQNAGDRAATPAAAAQLPAVQPVTETEAVVSQPGTSQRALAEAPEAAPAPERTRPTSEATLDRSRAAAERVRSDEPKPSASRRPHPGVPPQPQVTRPSAASRTEPASGALGSAAASPGQHESTQPAPSPVAEAVPDPGRPAEIVPAMPEPKFVEVVVPSAAVIGLQVDRALSSETARVEDRVEARVTRDVLAEGRRAIPAGSRVLGSVVLVERGGKLKDTARLGVRFHTLVLADGTQVPLHTETIFREGDPPSGESARKIGGAAVGGAILGAILGGGKGAVLGGATGAAGGTAAVMAGGRNPATLPAGTVVTARLSDPATIQVEKN